MLKQVQHDGMLMHDEILLNGGMLMHDEILQHDGMLLNGEIQIKHDK